jgi:hypothetical protein
MASLSEEFNFTWDEMIKCIAKQNNLIPDSNLYYDFLNCPINGHAYFVPFTLNYKPTPGGLKS